MLRVRRGRGKRQVSIEMCPASECILWLLANAVHKFIHPGSVTVSTSVRDEIVLIYNSVGSVGRTATT